MDQTEPEDQGSQRYFQECGAHPSLDRLDRLPLVSLAKAEEQGGQGTPGVFSLGPNYAPGPAQSLGYAFSTTTRSSKTSTIQFLC